MSRSGGDDRSRGRGGEICKRVLVGWEKIDAGLVTANVRGTLKRISE